MVTGTNMFSRSIGSAVGVALFGAIANAVLDASGHVDQSATAVNSASHNVFVAIVVICAVMVLASLLLPLRRNQVVV